ncbi:hypothetical protein ABH920_003294 [Catenulispora sp. EB89]
MLAEGGKQLEAALVGFYGAQDEVERSHRTAEVVAAPRWLAKLDPGTHQ